MRLKNFATATLLLFSCLVYSQINSQYIQKEIQNKKKWISKAKFETGYIITNSVDTLALELLVFKRKYRKFNYLFCVAKISPDSFSIHTAENIFEYKVGKSIYKSLHEKNECFFILELGTGQVSLYQRDAIPSDDKFKYFLRRENQNNYFQICPNESSFKLMDSSESNTERNQPLSDRVFFQSDNSAERFKLFVKLYFDDCEKVLNGVKSDFYTIYDIPSIVNIYNHCFNPNLQ